VARAPSIDLRRYDGRFGVSVCSRMLRALEADARVAHVIFFHRKLAAGCLLKSLRLRARNICGKAARSRACEDDSVMRAGHWSFNASGSYPSSGMILLPWQAWEHSRALQRPWRRL